MLEIAWNAKKTWNIEKKKIKKNSILFKKFIKNSNNIPSISRTIQAFGAAGDNNIHKSFIASYLEYVKCSNNYCREYWSQTCRKFWKKHWRPWRIMRFNKGIHNIMVQPGFASENTVMLSMCLYGASWLTNMATDSFNTFISCWCKMNKITQQIADINWQAGTKLIWHVWQTSQFKHVKGNSGLALAQSFELLPIDYIVFKKKNYHGVTWPVYKVLESHVSEPRSIETRDFSALQHQTPLTL